MTNEICEKEGHEFGEEIHEEVRGIFTGTMVMPPDKNITQKVVKRYKQCTRCGFKLYI